MSRIKYLNEECHLAFYEADVKNNLTVIPYIKT
jgi:hypothetical protein